MRAKLFIWLIAASVTANALMAGFLLKHLTGPAKPEVSVTVTPYPASASSRPSAKGGHLRGDSSAMADSVEAADTSWNDIQSEDLKEFVRRLRACGCPEQTVRDIILAEVNRLYAPKLRALWPQEMDSPFWKVQSRDRSEFKKNRERSRTQQQLQKEKSALLVELLGVDPEKEMRKEEGWDEGFDWNSQRVGFLPEEKREAALKYLNDFDDKMQDFYERNRGMWDAQSRAEQRQLEAEKLAGLSQILTPEELREFDLRQSQTAQQMSFELRSLPLNRDEYEDLFDIRKKYGDSIYNYGDIETKEARDQVEASKKAMNNDIIAALGETKGKEYQRSQDYSYQELNRITKKLELPAGTAAKVYDYKETAEKSVRDLQTDQSITPDQRNQALQQIRTETEKTIKNSLGDAGYKRYLRQGGWWINNLAPMQAK
jgi:hypothetical protein